MTAAWSSSAAAASFAAATVARTYAGVSLVTAGVQYQVTTSDELVGFFKHLVTEV